MNRTVDVLVVGAGPAGLATAARLAAAGAGRVEVLEREAAAGGVPRHCARPGFGADGLGRPVDGPAYARRAVREALRAGAVVRTGVSATGWAGPLTLDVTAPTGLERIRARAVVLATGARERPRSARLVPGTRPAGVLTTGELQRIVARSGAGREHIGRRAVVVGGDPVARGAVGTLRAAGVDVTAVVTGLPSPTVAFAGVPVLTGAVVTELLGRGRLTGVAVRGGDGRAAVLRCDTVVFTGDWIPDHELARARGLPLAPGTRGPVTDHGFRTTRPGIFAVGNLLRGVEPALAAAAEGRTAGGGARTARRAPLAVRRGTRHGGGPAAMGDARSPRRGGRPFARPAGAAARAPGPDPRPERHRPPSRTAERDPRPLALGTAGGSLDTRRGPHGRPGDGRRRGGSVTELGQRRTR
ncbi:hypothetical protein STANM309S_01211 [Streptomyces tanashiensis]